MTSPRIFNSREALEAAVGEPLGPTDWHVVTQERIDDFAKASEDFNWIHIDPERAAAESPMKTTIAHGLYTLSLGPKLQFELIGFEDLGMVVNYGYNRVRFPAPVPPGSRIRMGMQIAEVKDAGGAVELTLAQTFEREGAEKPICIAEILLRFIP